MSIARLIWESDNRTVIRDLKQISEQSTKTSRTLKDDSAGASREFDNLGKSTKRVHSAFSNLAGLVGIGGVAFGMKDLVQGGIQLQGAQVQLQAALKGTGSAASNTYAQLTKAAEALSTRGGFSNVQNLQALTAFTRETHSASKATEMLSLATNIARGRNIDLSSAQMLVQRAAGGSIGKLQALLGPMVAVKSAAFGLSQAHKEEVFRLDEESKAMGTQGPLWLKQQEILRGITPQVAALATLQDKHATATMVMSAAQREFAGSTLAYGKTTAGQMSNMKNAVKNLVDSIGQSLLPTVNKLITIMAGLFTWLGKNKGVLYALIGTIGAVSAVLAAHAVITATAEAATIAWGAATTIVGGIITGFRTVVLLLGLGFEAMGVEATAAWAAATLGITLAIPLIIAIATHFSFFKKIAVDAFKWVLSAASTVWNWIKGNWPLLLSILSGPFGFAAVFIATHFKQVEGWAGDVLHFLEGIASAVFHAITWPFVKAWDFIKGIPSKIGSAFSGIPGMLGHLGGGLLHSLSFGLFQEGGLATRPHRMGSLGMGGSDRIPALLGRDEGVLTGRGMQMIGGEAGLNAVNRGQAAGGAGGSGAFTVTVQQPWVLKLDSRTITQGVLQYSLRKAARGPSTLSGGQLVTGVAGAIDNVG